MKTSHVLWLLFVSAIWGASHSLVRISVAEWGSGLTTYLRISIAAVTLLIVLRGLQKKLNIRENLKEFLVIALLNASLPMFLFAYAARTLPASYSVILNATMPIFNALFSSLFLKDPFTAKKLLGMMLGIAGITLLEERGTIPHFDSENAIAMGCGLLASACYALAAVYLKRSPKKIDSTVLTAGSNLFGSVFLLPFAFQGNWHWAGGAPLISVIFLGALGSGLAFIIYYQLIHQIGAFKASMTTFIMPVFGLFWSWLFLDEHPNVAMLIGIGMILSATTVLTRQANK